MAPRPIEASCRAGASGSAEAKKAKARLRKLGPPPETSSRSTSSIVAGNVFTLFNAIIGVFFVLDLSLGLFADALFGLIAIINSYIGIRQELKAKETLDQLAVLVAPKAKVVRDGAVVELRADEVVPGDVVARRAGRPAGRRRRGRSPPAAMTLDESMLTGEADGIRKGRASGCSRARSASRAPATTRSTRSARTATPAGSPARRAPSATRPRRCRRRSTR